MHHKLELELEAMRKALVIRNYATKTVSTYVSVLKRYLEQLDKPIACVTSADIHEWQYHLVNEAKVSWSLFNQIQTLPMASVRKLTKGTQVVTLNP